MSLLLPDDPTKPTTPTLAAAVKAGPRTSEFYFSIAASALSGAFAVGLVTDGDGTWSKLAGLAAFMLTTIGYQVSRGLAKWGASTVLVLGLAVAVMSTVPACSSSQRTKVIFATVATIDTAETSLEAYTKSHEAQLIASASSLADGQAQLAAFRSQVTKVETAIATGYKLAAAAALENDDPSLTTLAKGAELVATELVAIEKGLAP